MKTYQKILSLTALLTTTSVTFAQTFDPYFEMLVFAGITDINAQDALVNVGEVEVDKLVQTNSDDWNAWTGQLGVGYMHPLFEDLSTEQAQWLSAINPQLNLYYLGNGEINGDVWRFQSEDWNQLDSTTQFDSTRLMFDLAVTIIAIEKFSLYALGGAGISWNSTQLSAIPNQEGIDCGVAPYNLAEDSSSFAYEFGGGITFDASDRAAISLEYLYTGITDVALGSDADADLALAGSDFDVNTQAVLLGLRIAL